MKHLRVLCTLLTATLTASCLSSASALTGVSPWAKTDVRAAQAASLAPDTFAALDARTPVSRAEFCAVALKLYEAERQIKVPRTKKVYFKDCKDPDVNTAYEMKLVSGRDPDTFAPNEPVSRQDLCVILDNIRTKCEVDKPDISVSAKSFPDSKDLRPYAVSATEVMLSTGIMKGVEVSTSNDPEKSGRMVTQLQPQGTATREQSLIMANRFLSTFDAKPLKPSDQMNNNDTILASRPSSDLEVTEFKADKDTQNEAPEKTDSSTQTEVDLDQEEEQFLLMDEPIPVSGTVEEKKNAVFGEGNGYYTEQAVAEANMEQITVKVWSLLSSGQKTPSTKTFKVHKAIADEVRAVFDEIFEGDEKFPIKDAGGYAWRSSPRSEHRQGTAIDLNYMENMECSIDKNGKIIKVTTGSHWTPILDPYSIPAGGDVVRAFAAHGFAWGGDAWTSKRDYMHFSYFGT